MISLSKAEKSYIQAGIVASPPSRADGRALLDWRAVSLVTGVAPLSNGSARLTIGSTAGGGRTEVLAAAKLEVESIQDDSDAQDGGRIACSVSCSPAAYPHLPNPTLDDLQSDLTSLLHQTLSHHTLHPSNLGILKSKKSWLLNLDALVLSDAGNLLDALFMAARAALWDTRVPRTRAIEYKAISRVAEVTKVDDGEMEVDQDVQSSFDTRHMPHNATDFELPDYWDEGQALDGRDRWPVAVTLNLESPTYYLDATNQEEAASPLRLFLAFSFPSSHTDSPVIQALRVIGPGELTPNRLKELVKLGERHARDTFTLLNTKLEEEQVRRSQKERKRFEQSR